jgi:hypothetical protein
MGIAAWWRIATSVHRLPRRGNKWIGSLTGGGELAETRQQGPCSRAAEHPCEGKRRVGDAMPGAELGPLERPDAAQRRLPLKVLGSSLERCVSCNSARELVRPKVCTVLGIGLRWGLDERLLQTLLLLSIVTARASVAVFLLFCPSLLLLAGVVHLRLACALPQLFSACFHSCPAVPRPIAAQPPQLANCSLRRPCLLYSSLRVPTHCPSKGARVRWSLMTDALIETGLLR